MRVWGAGDTEQHCSGSLHFPGVGELLCLWQLHPRLPTSAAPEGECLSPCVCAGCTEPLARSIHTAWPDLQWLVGNVTAGAGGSSGVMAFSLRLLAGKQ